jgi:hypothetical protein
MHKPIDPLNKLCKWRGVLAGWAIGSKKVETPGVRAVRNTAERLLVLRVEVSTLLALMLEKKVFTEDEFRAKLQAEAMILDDMMEKEFPGFRSVADGIDIYDVALAADTMQRKGFPP